MRPLSGLDASFLHMENSRVTGRVAGLIVLGPAATGRTLTVESIRAHVAARLPLPQLRRRLAEVPFGLDRPYWIDDYDVDLDYHVRGDTLPAPGGTEQLVELVSRLHATRLDRAHPLWEYHVINGLEGGKVAFFTKCHHAAIDGKAAMGMLAALMSADPDTPPRRRRCLSRSPGRASWRCSRAAGSAR